MHAKFDMHMAKPDALDEALKVSRKEVVAIKGVVEKQRARLDAVGARMAELKNRRDEASASTATCRK